MADNLTVRTDGIPVSGAGSDGSAKKSKLEQQVEALGEKIKHRTGRAVDDEVLRAMVMRKAAKAERADQAEKSKQDYQKNTANESVQARQTEDKGAIIGRAREMHTADGLTRHQRQLVSSDPNAPTILPPATHPPITAEGAAAVLEKVFAFLKPTVADAPALNVENYSETLVPRAPTQPPEKSLRDGGQQQPSDRPVTGNPTGEQPTGEQPSRPGEQPTTGRPQQPTGEQPTTGRPQVPTGEQPTTGRPQVPTGEQPKTGRPQQPTGEQPTTGRPQIPTGEQPTTGRPQIPTGEQPTTGRPQIPTHEQPATGRPQIPTTQQPTTGRPQLPGQQPMVAKHSGKTPLGQTIALQTRGLPASGGLPRASTRANAEAPTDRPVSGDPGTEPPIEQPGGTTTRPPVQQTTERPSRPVVDGDGRPVGGDDPEVPRPPQQTTIKMPGQRQPADKTPAKHSGRTQLGGTTSTAATDGSRTTPLGTTVATAPGTGGTTIPTTPATPGTGSPPSNTPSTPPTGGPRPGAGGGIGGGPTAGRSATVRAARPLPSEGSGSGAVMSLRGGPAGRRTRATDVTTEDPPFVNNGGGFDTTTSWDGMHFNWEAFFTLFLFKYQEDENEARRMMKELREAMHKLAQEGIKAKIALEKMNQAFERAEKAFELGNALKGVMDNAAQAAQGGQQQQQQQGADGTQQPNSPQGNTPQQPSGQEPGTVDPAAAVTAGQPNPNDPGAGATTPGNANPQGPRPQQQAQTPGGQRTTPGGQQTTPGGQQTNPNGTRNGPNGNRPGANGNQQGGDQQQQGHKMPGAGLVGNVSEHLRAAMERLNAELISSAQRGGSEVDARIRSNYMQAQGLLNQMVQILAMSRSK